MAQQSAPSTWGARTANDPAQVSAVIEQHYRDNWADVKAQFIAKLADCNVDDEAKETFVEALELHEIGHYRAVVRLLFPEIERVALIEFYDGIPKGIASLKDVREAAENNLGFSSFGSVQYSFNLYHRVSKHLYENASDVAAVQKYANDPVPNRHASLHGLVVYKKVNNSLNAIIMAEMMLWIVSDLKEELKRHDNESNAS